MKKRYFLKIFSTLIIISLLAQFNGVLASDPERGQDETNIGSQDSMNFYGLNTSKSDDIISIEYGDNVKYEYLSNGLTRATLPFPTVYNDYYREWEPVDLNFEWNDVLSSWSPRKSQQEISFSQSSTADELFKVKDDVEWITFSLSNENQRVYDFETKEFEELSTIQSVSPTVQNNNIVYGNIFPRTDISYKVLPFGVKETILLHSAPLVKKEYEDSYLLFEGELIISNNLSLWIDGEELKDQHIRTDKTISFRKHLDGNMVTVFSLSAPFAYDSNSTDEDFINCYYSLTINDGKIQFRVETPIDWLLSSNRVYPVYIDPTVETYYPLKDTYCRSYRPTNKYGGGTYMKVNPYSYDKNRAYLQFDLSSIPSGSSINSATFRYYYYYNEYNPGGRTHDFHKVTSSWTEADLSWNYQPSVSSSIESSYTFPTSFGWIEADLTDFVQDKVDGETDYGFMINDRNEGETNNGQPRMYSKEYGSYSPELEVEYSSGSILLPEALDNSYLSWAIGGDAYWFGQSNTYYYDGDAAESGDIGNSEESEIRTTVNGPGTLSFYWKVSSEPNFDYLRFYIDEVQQKKISGEVGWQQKTYSIDSGSHDLLWEYTKDGSDSDGSDCGWLDKVEFNADSSAEILIRDTGYVLNDFVNLDYSDDVAKKYLDIGSDIMQIAVSAKLYVYGMGHDDYVSTDSHRLLVNGDYNDPFNPIDEFGTDWSWQYFNIPIDKLQSGTNTFNFKDVNSDWTKSDLKIGIDTNDYGEPDYGSSYIQTNYNEKEGELKIYLVIETTGDPDGDGFEYSGTVIQDYLHLGDLYPHGNDFWCDVQSGMSNIGGWQEKFLVEDNNVDDEEFMSGSGDDSEDSDIHFHYGHGALNDIAYTEWFFGPGLSPDEVYLEWGDGDNEFMLLYSCEILADDEWKATLDRGHLIIGWVSSGPADADSIIENFLVHINDGDSIYTSWHKATRNSGWSGTAGIIANNKIAIYDHLWGQGPVTPDEFICDTNAYRFSWATPQ